MGTRFGIKDTYEFEFVDYTDEGERNNFIDTGNLVGFSYSEQVGGELPTFKLEFSTERDNSLVEFSEKKPFKVCAYNKGNDLVWSCWFIPTKILRNKIGDDKYMINAWGMMVGNGYYHSPEKLITDLQSSKQTIQDTVEQYGFKFETDVDDNDEQYWIRPNISGKLFVDEVLRRAFVPDSFPVIAIESHEGERVFHLNDYHKLSGAKVHDVDPKAVKVNNFQLIEEPGLLNNFYGFERVVSQYNIEDGIREDQSFTHKPNLSNVGEVPVLNIKKSADVEFLNENVHKTYTEAKLRALAGWSIFGNKNLVLNLTEQIFHPMRLLELVKFETFKIPYGKEGGYSQHLGGKYVITKKLFYLNNQTFKTTLVVSKEFLNE